MKKKIGIITFHNAINYGAVLQSYALERFLINRGENAEIIDYRCPAVDIQYSFKCPAKSSSVLNFFAHNITCFFRSGKKNRFEKFVKDRLVLSEKVDRESLHSCKYDVVITGSDQVFNPYCSKSDPSYFLDFATTAEKYSYAASCGSIEQFNASKLDTIGLLNSFKMVSLRERTSVEYLKDKLNTEVLLSVDPVWLLKKEEWSKLLGFANRRPYILVYNLMDLKSLRRYVKKFSKEKKLPVISINRTIMGDMTYLPFSKLRSNCSPSEFLELIANSSYFFTDSFHGTSFAMIFEKKFGVFLNDSKNNTNSRIVDILNLSGLSDRIVKDDNYDADASIDHKVIKDRMRELISESEKYVNIIIG